MPACKCKCLSETQGYWNGEPTPCRRVLVVVAKPSNPAFWFAAFSGQVRQAVEVQYGEQIFYLDDEDGNGWHKVTIGCGGPDWGHKQLEIEKLVPLNVGV